LLFVITYFIVFTNNVINAVKLVHSNVCYAINNSDRWPSSQKLPKNFRCSFHTNDRVKVKGKTIPLQACTDPEGSRRLRLPDFKTIGT